jgi:hypothetical protein
VVGAVEAGRGGGGQWRLDGVASGSGGPRSSGRWRLGVGVVQPAASAVELSMVVASRR